jgi:hypothetical protein
VRAHRQRINCVIGIPADQAAMSELGGLPPPGEGARRAEGGIQMQWLNSIVTTRQIKNELQTIWNIIFPPPPFGHLPPMGEGLLIHSLLPGADTSSARIII